MSTPPIAYALDDQKLHMLLRSRDFAGALQLIERNNAVNFDTLYPEPSGAGVVYVPLAASLNKSLADVGPLELDSEFTTAPLWNFLAGMREKDAALFRSPRFWMRPDVSIAQELVYFDRQIEALAELVRWQPVDRDKGETRAELFSDETADLLLDIGLTCDLVDEFIIMARTRCPQRLSLLEDTRRKLADCQRRQAAEIADEHVTRRPRGLAPGL